MDSDEYLPPGRDFLAERSEALVKLAEAVGRTTHTEAKRFLLRFMENICLTDAPPKGEVVSIDGGKHERNPRPL